MRKLLHEERIAARACGDDVDEGVRRGPVEQVPEHRAHLVLGEITDGSFAKEWMAEYDAGLPNYKRYYQENTEHRVEQTGRKLRPLMSWISENE